MYNLYFKTVKREKMTSLSIVEKIALEDVFICLEDKKARKLACIKRYFLFYKNEFFKKKFLLIKN